MRALLLSNSTNLGEAYLGYAKKYIGEFLGKKPLNVLFIPYAAINFSYDEYETKVIQSLSGIPYPITGIHRYKEPLQAIRNADVIITGGGNTWKLTRILHENKLIALIRDKVKNGTPYIGWSAGSNVACPTLCTTNDMPVTDPHSFETIGLVPFQINSHYTDEVIPNHGGESRETRIKEYITENRNIYVAGLREGTFLHLENTGLKLIGNKTMRVFKYGQEPMELSTKDNLDFLVG